MSQQAVSRFIRYYEQSRSLVQKPGSGRRTKLTPTVHQVVEAKMQCDDEITATQLQHLLCQLGVHMSLATIQWCCKELGWTFQGSRYCQLIYTWTEQVKDLAFVQACIANNETFDDVIWNDETSVQLECHRRHFFRKQGQPPKLKPGPKQERGNTCMPHRFNHASLKGKWMHHFTLKFSHVFCYVSSSQNSLIPIIS